MVEHSNRVAMIVLLIFHVAIALDATELVPSQVLPHEVACASEGGSLITVVAPNIGWQSQRRSPLIQVHNTVKYLVA